MMMMSGRNSSGFPFTATQWEELQNQVLIFKYMVLGIPIPSYLLFSIKTSFLEPHQHDKIGWNCGGEMRMERKVDPEPGRCRRTDGKKWRCSKLAYTDSKYCERHMHRGKNRSRKHVEEEEAASTGIIMVNPSSTATQSLSLSLSSFETHASTEKPTLCLLGSSSYRLKQVVDHEPCGTRRSFSGSSMEDGTSWQLQSLKQSKHDQDDDDKRKPKRKIHRFIDEWPPKHRDSWLDYDDHKSSKSSSDSTTKLSISISSTFT
ncbi:hypothetical protein ES288_A13G225900v1 [Gossypium darwinii]|uniref:Growth-regulating factor n=1 Tax=Gossypium darwinii TaxID=34276 RepID=A0A5D2E286_GOSDA|nr:hypothetical protein ES288_A13G225900v1 [Gossypium darwinii]